MTELQEKAKVVDMLHDKLMGVNNTLAFFDGELQVGVGGHTSSGKIRQPPCLQTCKVASAAVTV